MKNCLLLLFFLTVTLYTSKSFSQDNLKNYWQQEVNYTIQVKLEDVKNFLNATESIDYINHSPDTIKYIWFHLWPNAYKNNNTAFAKQKVENGAVDFYFSKEEDRGFIDSLNFEVNGEKVKLEYDSANIDIARIWLNKPLAPKSQITITTPFRVKIPKNFSRMGHAGQQYQISQWYPKPAVYDKKGWHPIPYLDQGEFYSEYGVFDVFITLPKNYVIDATGLLLNEDEKKWLQIKEAASLKKLGLEMSDEQKSLAEKDTAGGILFPASSTEMKTLHYHAEDVHDFAWFADKRYLIVKDAVTLESGKKVETAVLFTENHSNVWRNAVHFVDSAVYYYSKWVGDYPYPHATAVDGALVAGGGMEYPMITVIGKTVSAGALDGVIAHEVGHNWFYGILGFNEREHPWMDEGINSYYEDRYTDRNLKTGNSIAPKFLGLQGMTSEKLKYLTYLIVARPHNDQPADIPATEYTQLNYGAIIYSKVPVMMSHLAASMGQEKYDSTMHTLFNEWKFKHVYPEDMKTVFEKSSPMYFDWFFNQYLNTTDLLDYKLWKAKDTTHIGSSVYYNVNVKNAGAAKAPYSITALKDNKPVVTKWYGGVMGKLDVLFPYGNYDALTIDYKNQTPEFNHRNDQLKMHGIFRRVEKLKLQPIVSIENPKRTQLFFSPIVGWNNYDKGMAGLALYNSFIPSTNFHFVLAPMYSFQTKQMTGIGNIEYFIYPKNGFIKNICLNLTYSSFHYDLHSADSSARYQRYSSRIDFNLKNKSPRLNAKKWVTLRNIFFIKEYYPYIVFTNDDGSVYHLGYLKLNNNYLYNQLKFSFEKQQVINPYSIYFNIENVLSKISYVYPYIKDGILFSTEFNWRINYKKKNDGFGIRLYADYAPLLSNLSGFNPHLTVTPGSDDYAFDEVFLARSEETGFLSHQMLMNRGGMKFHNPQNLSSPIGSGGNGIITANLTTSLIIPLPVFVFADFGYQFSNPTYYPYKPFQYDGGIGVTVIPGVCTAYLTLFESDDIKLNTFLSSTEYSKWYNRYFFTLNFSKLVPFDKIRTLKI